ncbi:DUF3592 domain-containing protein [Streptomyces sp. IBSBF 2953]|uniref:DUF3592 domain-containing protein n=1 Tax=Streptomyces TaxID=1883 RepID=UPI00211A5388|nr:DUF3592 domain-containing protein [Streptomyces scabiei]MCQ9185814.1 DUF3592 domain-containing protein [Streptomyces hayashii]MDX3119422.1 DUF3592 domain-containing protein [Streptomyces scabiei]
MEAFFYVVPGIMAAGLLFAMSRVLIKSRRFTRAWSSGLTAEARCLRAYTTLSGGGDTAIGSTLRQVFEFTTRDGRVVRFEEVDGPGTILEGDIVTVHYAADRPEEATAKAPARGRLFTESGCLLGFLGAILAFCVFFMVTVHWMFDEAGTLMP